MFSYYKYSFLNGKYENFLDEKTAMWYQPVFLSLFLSIQDLAEWSLGNAGLSQSVQEGAVVTSGGPQEKSVGRGGGTRLLENTREITR